jgi:hypothetical protein
MLDSPQRLEGKGTISAGGERFALTAILSGLPGTYLAGAGVLNIFLALSFPETVASPGAAA